MFVENTLEYWTNRWSEKQTQWDIGEPSSPMKLIIDGLFDKSARIFIPGCGNAYEVDYLLSNGFLSITLLDIVPEVIDRLKNKYEHREEVTIIEGDFFSMNQKFDCILEQTFFCSLPIQLRSLYVEKMYDLLSDSGILKGVLFNRQFRYDQPPFGGSIEEYMSLFSPYFRNVTIDTCTYSIPQRQGSEVFFFCQK